ncbi:hypothetical protein [Granulicoccus phenolivorans]|uniref:hypothetical protein n=1 Tax=Granulicoccus phenolivorans TaxID=266854 RepID=UPI000421EF7E|nr:hypothetical protein [Granulicoccus phenolivorans]
MSASGQRGQEGPRTRATDSAPDAIPSYTTWLTRREDHAARQAPAPEIAAGHRWTEPVEVAQHAAAQPLSPTTDPAPPDPDAEYADPDAEYAEPGARRSLGWADEPAFDTSRADPDPPEDTAPASPAAESPWAAPSPAPLPARPTGPTIADRPNADLPVDDFWARTDFWENTPEPTAPAPQWARPPRITESARHVVREPDPTPEAFLAEPTGAEPTADSPGPRHAEASEAPRGKHRAALPARAAAGLGRTAGRRRTTVAGVSGFVVAGVLAALLIPQLSASPADTAAAPGGGAPYQPAPITTATPQPSEPETTAPAPAESTSQPAPPPSQAQELAPIAPVTGIPAPACPADLTWDRSKTSQSEYVRQISQKWDMELTGSGWTDSRNREVVKLFGDTLDAVDCTGYLDRVRTGNGGRLTVSSDPIASWAWGDYGLTKPNTLSLDFVKFREGYAEGTDRGRLVRLIIHEMAHSFNSDRFQNPEYWQRNQQLFREVGPISAYGARDSTETFADAVGYYVARCAHDNPYDQARNKPYYEMVKKYVFDGKEFGGPVGSTQKCN